MPITLLRLPALLAGAVTSAGGRRVGVVGAAGWSGASLAAGRRAGGLERIADGGVLRGKSRPYWGIEGKARSVCHILVMF